MDYISKLEAEQMKAEVPQFRVGDTVKVSNRIKEGNRERHRSLKVRLLRFREPEPERHLRLESFPTV